MESSNEVRFVIKTTDNGYWNTALGNVSLANASTFYIAQDAWDYSQKNIISDIFYDVVPIIVSITVINKDKL